MKIKNKYFLLILSFLLTAMATQAESDSIARSVKQANELYSNGQYSDAVKLYEKLLQNGVSAELYYNLGNSYYKIDEIGLSILNYERALRLNPGFRDAAYNLEIAESKIVDKVTTSASFFVKRWINGLINKLSSNQWAFVSLVFFILSIATFFVFIFSNLRKRRKFSFYASIILALFFMGTFVFSGVRKEQFVKHNSAIVLSGQVSAKSAPDASGTELFQLHEGTKVHIKSTLGAWTEITLENGALGWIEEKAIERI
ncbi:MAG: tetratricopeptide repeat protein [Paludibacteraceae bacterium]